LAQVYGIVKQHDGFIDVSSQIDQGTIFTVYLPALVLSEIEAVEPKEEATAAGEGETILLVEDDERTRQTMHELLEILNYRVLAAKDGRKALDLFDRHIDEIALVVSDMVMPIMSGALLHTKLKERKPDIKMMVMTGYPLDKEGKNLLSQGVVAWVQKPFDIEKIANEIKKALNPA
jgi:CheY-like chemotaxis protein